MYAIFIGKNRVSLIILYKYCIELLMQVPLFFTPKNVKVRHKMVWVSYMFHVTLVSYCFPIILIQRRFR